MRDHRRPQDYLSPSAPSTARTGRSLCSSSSHMALPLPSTGRASPRPDRGVRPSGRPGSPVPALPRPHREGRPGPSCFAATAKAAAASGAEGRGPSPSRPPSVRSPSSGRGSLQPRWLRWRPVGRPAGHVSPTRHHPESPRCRLRSDERSILPAGAEPTSARPRRRQGSAGDQHDPRRRPPGRRTTDRRTTPCVRR